MEQTEKTEEQILKEEKLLLEIQKIKLENKEIEAKWYRKPQWYAILIPLILGIATILIAYKTGFLNQQALVNRNENIKNQNESILLKTEIEKFEKLKESLLLENQDLLVTQNLLKDSIKIFTIRNKELKTALNITLSKTKSDNSKIKELFSQIDHLASKMQDTLGEIRFHNTMSSASQAKLYKRLMNDYDRVVESLKACESENLLLKTKSNN